MNQYNFRVWDEEENKFWYFNLQEILERKFCYEGSFDRKITRYEKELMTEDDDVRDCFNCANNTEPDEVDNGCYMCCKGLENNFLSIDEAVEYLRSE